MSDATGPSCATGASTPTTTSPGAFGTDPIAAADEIATPGRAGYRWPAEWEPHAATWLAWPHNVDTWPDRLARAERAFAEIVHALAGREIVNVLVPDEACEALARRRLAERGLAADGPVVFHTVATDDAWIRDSGPVFLVRDEGEGPRRVLVDFRFDAWGAKYPPWEQDDAVPRRVAEITGLPRFEANFVFEAGSIDGDGRGTVLTTESCLLHPNRGAGRTRDSMERRLADWLGAREVLWLSGGIAGDDTDGHVDDVARFTDVGVVVTAVEGDPSDANHAPLAENFRRLRRMRGADGKPLSLATLPMPPAQRAGGLRCPASYANFYVANGTVLLPTFGAPSDARATAVLRELFPGRDVVGVPSGDLVIGLGAVHCLSQQEPA